MWDVQVRIVVTVLGITTVAAVAVVIVVIGTHDWTILYIFLSLSRFLFVDGRIVAMRTYKYMLSVNLLVGCWLDRNEFMNQCVA